MTRHSVALVLSEEDRKLLVQYFDKHPELKIGVHLGKIVMDHLKAIEASSDNQ